jgi:hypothetical protein
MELWASTRVDVDISPGFDFAALETYAWREAALTPSPLVTKTILDAVDEQMRSRGLTRVDENPDCWVSTVISLSGGSPTGALKVEIALAGADQPGWRGLAVAGLLPNDVPVTKRQKRVKKIVKKMFRQVPGR